MLLRLTPFTAAVFLVACQPGEENNQFDNAASLEVEDTIDEAPLAESDAAPPANSDDSVSSDDPRPPVVPPASPSPKTECAIARSSDWQAHVDAMPGPNSRPKLIVRGDVTVPTGGYALSLRMGPIAESYPVQITVHLVARPPEGPASQAVVTREVRGTWPSPQRVGSVTVRCGGKTLARIAPVDTAF